MKISDKQQFDDWWRTAEVSDSPCETAWEAWQAALAAAPVAPNDGRDAYEGAREDLLDWKRRALDAEAKLRKIGAVLVEGIDVRKALQDLATDHEARERVAAEIAGK